MERIILIKVGDTYFDLMKVRSFDVVRGVVCESTTVSFEIKGVGTCYNSDTKELVNFMDASHNEEFYGYFGYDINRLLEIARQVQENSDTQSHKHDWINFLESNPSNEDIFMAYNRSPESRISIRRNWAMQKQLEWVQKQLDELYQTPNKAD